MKVADHIRCTEFRCADVVKEAYTIPRADIDPEMMRMLMISEVPPLDAKNDFYAPGNPFYMQTTLQAFRDAGVEVSSMDEILKMGIYITTAVKCGKTGYSVPSAAIKNCVSILDKEIQLFPGIRVVILNGDVAIKSFNIIAELHHGNRVIPRESTYKIRKGTYTYGDIRVFPSYILTGRNFLIEKSKRRMIAEDIREAVKYLD